MKNEYLQTLIAFVVSMAILCFSDIPNWLRVVGFFAALLMMLISAGQIESRRKDPK